MGENTIGIIYWIEKTSSRKTGRYETRWEGAPGTGPAVVEQVQELEENRRIIKGGGNTLKDERMLAKPRKMIFDSRCCSRLKSCNGTHRTGRSPCQKEKNKFRSTAHTN
jgi:hypothetical protein